ncbi:MAG: hypothetical protein AAF658_10810 [Myxococcota bacterium]
MARRESGAIARVFGLVVVALVVAGLLGVVAYLLSEINRGKYRLAANEKNELVIQRGIYLPMGFAHFEPEAKDLEECYAPLPIPTGQTVATSEVYEDRADLDRALFAVLAGWSRTLLESPDDESFELALNYVARAELLPGLSEEQRIELRQLRADTAYRNGRRILSSVVDQLRDAVGNFEDALRLGTSRPEDARRWIDEIERRMAAIGVLDSEKRPSDSRASEREPREPSWSTRRDDEEPARSPNGDDEPSGDSLDLPLEKPKDDVSKKDKESAEEDKLNWRL